LLRRMIGAAKLTRKELSHCLAAVTHTINSRPLTTLTEDSEDLQPLTPSMLMKDNPVSGLPEFDNIQADDLRGAYQKLRGIKEALQARFRKEYLSQLIQGPGSDKIREVCVGDLVIVGSDNKKRFEWPLGRVLKVHPGRDGAIRVATVKTTKGIVLRPVQRLYFLEVVENESEKRSVNRHCVDKQSDSEMKPSEIPYNTRAGRLVKKPKRYSNWNY